MDDDWGDDGAFSLTQDDLAKCALLESQAMQLMQKKTASSMCNGAGSSKAAGHNNSELVAASAGELRGIVKQLHIEINKLQSNCDARSGEAALLRDRLKKMEGELDRSRQTAANRDRESRVRISRAESTWQAKTDASNAQMQFKEKEVSDAQQLVKRLEKRLASAEKDKALVTGSKQNGGGGGGDMFKRPSARAKPKQRSSTGAGGFPSEHSFLSQEAKKMSVATAEVGVNTANVTSSGSHDDVTEHRRISLRLDPPPGNLGPRLGSCLLSHSSGESPRTPSTDDSAALSLLLRSPTEHLALGGMSVAGSGGRAAVQTLQGSLKAFVAKNERCSSVKQGAGTLWLPGGGDESPITALRGWPEVRHSMTSLVTLAAYAGSARDGIVDGFKANDCPLQDILHTCLQCGRGEEGAEVLEVLSRVASSCTPRQKLRLCEGLDKELVREVLDAGKSAAVVTSCLDFLQHLAAAPAFFAAIGHNTEDCLLGKLYQLMKQQPVEWPSADKRALCSRGIMVLSATTGQGERGSDVLVNCACGCRRALVTALVTALLSLLDTFKDHTNGQASSNKASSDDKKSVGHKRHRSGANTSAVFYEDERATDAAQQHMSPATAAHVAITRDTGVLQGLCLLHSVSHVAPDWPQLLQPARYLWPLLARRALLFLKQTCGDDDDVTSGDDGVTSSVVDSAPRALRSVLVDMFDAEDMEVET